MYAGAVSNDYDENRFSQLGNLPEKESVWEGREMRLLAQSPELPLPAFETRCKEPFSMRDCGRSIQPFMQKAGGSGRAGYSEDKGFYGEIEVTFEFGSDDKADNDSAKTESAPDADSSTDSNSKQEPSI